MDCMEWYVDAKKLQLEAYRMNYEKLQTSNNWKKAYYYYFSLQLVASPLR